MSGSNTNDVMSQKFVLELNAALAMENAGFERLNSRVRETSLPDVKQQLQHHIQESTEHKNRLQQLITDMGGQPTQERIGLPLPKFPQDMSEMMTNTMTKEELELKKTEEDLIIENAEFSCYFMLIKKAQMAGGVFQNAADILSLNMQDESKMIEWIKNNTSGMLTELWPKIQSTTASNSSSSSK